MKSVTCADLVNTAALGTPATRRGIFVRDEPYYRCGHAPMLIELRKHNVQAADYKLRLDDLGGNRAALQRAPRRLLGGGV